ncbi:MAG: hypothetical protein ACP5LN_11070 [Thermoproteota archaeon]
MSEHAERPIWEEFGITKEEWEALPEHRKKELMYSYQVAKAKGMSPKEIEQEVKKLLERSIEKITEQRTKESTQVFLESDKKMAVLKEIEESGTTGITASKIKAIKSKSKKDKAFLNDILESLEKEGYIVKEKKGNKRTYWTKANYEKFKAMRPKKITLKELYEELTLLKSAVSELRVYFDRKFSELESVIKERKS